MRGWGSKDKSLDNLSDKLDRLEEEEEETQTLCFRPIGKNRAPTHTQSEARGRNMFVIPVPFSKYHKDMLAHCKGLLEYRNGYMSINPRFKKLITSLRTALENGEGVLYKEATKRLEWRRTKVLELMSKGETSQSEIARILQVDKSTISRDFDYLRRADKSEDCQIC